MNSISCECVKVEKSDLVTLIIITLITLINDQISSILSRIISNYLAWCWFFKAMLRDLPDPFALTMFKFYKSLNCMNQNLFFSKNLFRFF